MKEYICPYCKTKLGQYRNEMLYKLKNYGFVCAECFINMNIYEAPETSNTEKETNK